MIKNVKFIKSVANFEQFIKDNQPQFAFVGRSNCGKSSLINFLCNQKIAKTSGTPGHTKLLNYFLVDGKFYFVDLPGYGFHKASKTHEQNWIELLESYFIDNEQLKMVFMLLDIRHSPSKEDFEMIKYLNYYNLPYIIVLTKADKLSKAQRGVAKQTMALLLKIGTDNIIISSADERLGKEVIEDLIKVKITEDNATT